MGAAGSSGARNDFPFLSRHDFNAGGVAKIGRGVCGEQRSWQRRMAMCTTLVAVLLRKANCLGFRSGHDKGIVD